VHSGSLKSLRNPTKGEARHNIKIYQKAIERFDVVMKVLRAENSIERIKYSCRGEGCNTINDQLNQTGFPSPNTYQAICVRPASQSQRTTLISVPVVVK
jgi:hypothetical protein